ncbi:MAG: prolipoprotein diacylglyceryl transferase family protein [Sedimentisphaerales bacterium]
MHPELFRIPFTELTVKSYGVMMVCGFIAAIYIIRKLSRDMGENAEHITTAALYSLIAGVAGARIFYVIHYWQDFRGRGLINVFAVWDGGLELLGGVLLAVLVIGIYLRVNKLPVRRYLDILGVGLMLALVFGRIGCFSSGCCFGKPTTCPIAVRFPYGSNAYLSQVRPDPARNRDKPYFELPDDFFSYIPQENRYYLKPYDQLTPQQRFEVKEGPFRCLPVWPTQLIESFCAFVATILLYLHRKKGIRLQKRGTKVPFFFKSGVTFSLMFIIYGTMRFFIEFLRDDNPYGADGLTVSQSLGIALVIGNILLIWLFARMSPDTP